MSSRRNKHMFGQGGVAVAERDSADEPTGETQVEPVTVELVSEPVAVEAAQVEPTVEPVAQVEPVTVATVEEPRLEDLALVLRNIKAYGQSLGIPAAKLAELVNLGEQALVATAVANTSQVLTEAIGQAVQGLLNGEQAEAVRTALSGGFNVTLTHGADGLTVAAAPRTASPSQGGGTSATRGQPVAVTAKDGTATRYTSAGDWCSRYGKPAKHGGAGMATLKGTLNSHSCPNELNQALKHGLVQEWKYVA